MLPAKICLCGRFDGDLGYLLNNVDRRFTIQSMIDYIAIYKAGTVHE